MRLRRVPPDAYEAELSAALDGGGMAVFQAVGAFRLFTGIEPDAERIRRHFLSMVGE